MVGALLDHYYEIYEKQFEGRYHLTALISDLREAIRRAELTNKQKQAIRLYYFDGLDQIEVADTLGINRSSVSRSLQLAKKKIARIYAQWEEYDNGELQI